MATLLDLVPNHTSSLHPWFVDARSGRGARHRDWYVWADPANGGGPPNNWLASTGQSAWTFDAQSGQYYLHNFLPSQPDLNWYNREVRTAFEAIMRFWFDRGVAGFRIDVAHGLFHDDRLRDNPMGDPGPDARFGQREVYNKNRPEVHGLYRTWRTLAESYAPSKLLLGETFVLDVDRMVAFYGDNDELQLAFNFPFVFSDFSAPALRLVVSTTLGRLPPAPARRGRAPTTTCPASPPDGARVMNGRSVWPCWRSAPCRAPRSCITATRSAWRTGTFPTRAVWTE